MNRYVKVFAEDQRRSESPDADYVHGILDTLMLEVMAAGLFAIAWAVITLNA